jgi:hypothetical protein
MAVSSPSFAAPSAPAATPRPAGTPAPGVGASGPATAFAPSVTVPLRFVVTGVLALPAAALLLAVRPDILAAYHYNQYTVAATHLWVLGFLGSVALGAMYQLVPVALETRLHSERLARWHFVLHLVGMAGMVWMFWRWDLKQVGHFGSALAAGVGLFAYNLGRTLRTVPRWNVVAWGITAALGWLGLTVLAGLAMAAAKCSYDSLETLPPGHTLRPALIALQATATWLGRFDPLGVMHAHAHLGGVGFFVMLIVAVSFKLVPMFTLSELQNPRRAGAALGLLNLGLAGVFLTLFVRSRWQPLAGLVVLAGLALYGLELRAILRARKRRVLDWGLRHFLVALGLLAVVAPLGWVLGWPGLPVTLLTTQLETVYGWLGLAGVVSLTVLGFLYKIVPFQVWYHSYAREVGRFRVPALADLYSERLQVAGLGLVLAGVLSAALGAALASEPIVRAGALALLAGLGVFLVNLGRMFRHFWRPRLEPLPGAGLSTTPADATSKRNPHEPAH